MFKKRNETLKKDENDDLLISETRIAIFEKLEQFMLFSQFVPRRLQNRNF